MTKVSPHGIGNCLASRAKFANSLKTKKPKYFLSIHSNLGDPFYTWQEKESGVEVWHMQDSYLGFKHARSMCYEISTRHKFNNRGPKAKKANPYFLINNVDMPSLVLECGFLNNPEEVNLLMDPGFHDALASTLAYVIKNINNGQV